MGKIDFVYCRYCGTKFGSEKMLLQTTCSRHTTTGKHEKFPGGLQNSYRCKLCGETKSQLKLLVDEVCSSNPDGKYHIPDEYYSDPVNNSSTSKTKVSGLKKSAFKAARAVKDDKGNLFAGVDSVTEDVGDAIVEKTGVFGEALRAAHDGGGDIYAAADVLVESLGRKILLFLPRIIWKLFVLIFKAVFALIYICIGGFAILTALFLKLLEKITYIRMFKFITKNLMPEYAADGPIKADGALGIVFNVIKVFGTVFYILVGVFTFFFWIFTKISSWFSFAKFFNKPLNLKK